MRRIQLNSVQLNAVRLNGIGECQRVSHAGAPPVVPDVPDIPEPDVPEEPDVDENGYLRFADPVVAEICATNWGDGTGITPEQAAAVTSIGTVFRENTSITSFEELPKFKQAQAIPAYAFCECNALQKIDLSQVTSLDWYAFLGCSSLSGVLDLSNTVSFGEGCFNDCTNLEDVYIGEKVESLNFICRYKKFKYSPDGVLRFPKLKTLGGPVFQDALIKRVESLGEVTDIGVYDSCYTFYGSTIEYCDIPATCTTIRSTVFHSAKSLSVVVCHAVEPPTIASYTFGNNASNFTIYVPDASVEAYKTATNWSAYADRILPLSEYVE